MTQEKGIPYRRHKPSAALRSFLDPLDPGSYFDCGQARLHGLDDALLREAESRGRAIGDDSFQLVATDMGLIYCRPSISFAIAARWDEVALIRPHGEDPVVLPINWPTHGELKFTVSKRLAGNVFRRWLQLRMQSERLARREKAERFNLRPTSHGQGAEEPGPSGDPASPDGEWEVVTEVEPTYQEPADPIMQSKPDRRDRGAAARRRRQNNAGKAKRRLRREGSTVSMPPGLADAARDIASSKSRNGTAGVPKPVRPRQSGPADPDRQALLNRPTSSDSQPRSSSPPMPSESPAPPKQPRQDRQSGQAQRSNPGSNSLGSRIGAEVTTHLPAPIGPDDLPSADSGRPTEGSGPANYPSVEAMSNVAPDETVLSAPPGSVFPLAPSGSSEVAEQGPEPAGANHRRSDEPVEVPRPEPEPSPSSQEAQQPAPEAIAKRSSESLWPEPADVVDSPLAEVTDTITLPEDLPEDVSEIVTEDLPEVRQSEPRSEEGRRPVDHVRSTSLPETEPGDSVITQPSWIGSPVSIVGAMVIISTFVLITATATASYRRSVELNDAIDPAGAELADPTFRTTINHQRFNPNADRSGVVPVPTDETSAPPATGTTEVTVLPLEGGPTEESELEGAPRLCNSNYSGCVPDVSDVDCPGDGDGPLYSTEPAVVMGDDVYELDTDGDGETCEADQPLHSELPDGD